jgi:hypothetical protein
MTLAIESTAHDIKVSRPTLLFHNVSQSFYCYCLTSTSLTAVETDRTNPYYIKKHPRLTVCLLRTCKQIKEEGEQVLYGDNKFHFWGHYCFRLGIFSLPVGFFYWVRELTMNLPITEFGCSLRPRILYYANPNAFNDEVPGPVTFSRDRLAN